MRVLAGDLGGTKVNLAIHCLETDAPLLQATYPSDGAGLEPILSEFLERAAAHLPLTAAALGVAGMCFQGRSHLPNLGWDLDETRLSELAGGIPFRIMNDLVATAHGVLCLPRERVEVLHGSWPPPPGPAVVIAPGTGLGVAQVPWVDGALHPVPTESGHSDLAPGDELELELVSFLQGRFRVASWERAVSGMGLANLYQFCRRRAGREGHPEVMAAMHEGPGPAISRLASSGEDPLSVEAMLLFVRLLGRKASNLALGMLARGGVFLGGGIPPKILPFLRRPEFRQAFLDKDRMRDFLTEVPLYVSLDQGAAVAGALRVARELAAGLRSAPSPRARS